MFRFLAAAYLLLASSFAFSSGKLSFKPKFTPDSKEVEYGLGLSVYERMSANCAYIGWVGGGHNPFKAESDWLKAESGLEMYLGALAAGLGGSYEINPDTYEDLSKVYASFSVTLW